MTARVPTALKQGLAYLTGTTISQLIPAIASPLLTRIYTPGSFGSFAIVLASIGVLAPITCLRYDLAVVLPHDDNTAGQLTVLSLLTNAAIAIIALIVLTFAHLLRSVDAIRHSLMMLTVALPIGLLVIGTTSVAQSWAIRILDFRIQSLALICQAIVTVVIQVGCGWLFGSHAWCLVLGLVVGYLASLLAYWPVVRSRLWPYARNSNSRQFVLGVARRYVRFPLFTLPYGLVIQVILKGVFFVFAALTTSDVIGQYALAQRVIFFPVVTIMAAASQIFFSRASRIADTAQLTRVVDVLLSCGPLIVGPIFMIALFFSRNLFVWIFGPDWGPAGQMASILAIPSLARSLTAWLDRIFDIRGRQFIALILATTYALISIPAMYVTLRATHNPTVALECFAAITVAYHLIWLVVALAVGDFSLSSAAKFAISTVAIAAYMAAVYELCVLFHQEIGVSIGICIVAMIPLVMFGIGKVRREMHFT